MQAFMDENFLLTTDTARVLYHNYAAEMPIIDYHCHVSPQDIYEDLVYDNITQVWLGGNFYGDHYKWRIMRACGEPERFITGDGSDYEKFLAFARCLPKIPGNPVYHWAHLELKRYFGCGTLLNEDTAPQIWTLCNEQLRGGLSVREILRRSNVTGLATTDDPLDTLEWHAKLAADPDFGITVRPAWRPDGLMNIHKAGFGEYLAKLGGVTDMASLRAAILARMDHFSAHGCSASDHGIEFLECVPATEAELDAILAKGLRGEAVSCREAAAYQYACLLFLGGEYGRRGWVMEIHYGAVRNINSARFCAMGADTGYDAIAPAVSVASLPVLLDALDGRGCLPKTVLFSLSPNDDAMLSTIAGAFQAEGVRGKVQQGSAWWFNDTKPGMLNQITTIASLAPLDNFLGMVTDSRSFLAYPRHEYFRRILCELLGKWVENGEYPNDPARLGRLVQNVAYYNIKEYFGY
ncbi:MAG: glucuronate isomerase [Oscillospiraceae bacterium]|jgi:glucuronate isomerase|nr:glucuronate isomerase [Oscillospiraceae bacterium]